MLHSNFNLRILFALTPVVPTPVSELSWPACGSDWDPLTARGGSGSLGASFGEEVLVPGGGPEPCAAA